MKLTKALLAICLSAGIAHAQGPEVTSWLQNTTNYGSHYVVGNSTPVQDNVLVNCQLVEYSTDWVYVHTHGIPSYVTGPFQDGNQSLAEDQNAIFKIPRNPAPNTGTLTSTNLGNIGVFINGVALFDYRDGVAWNPFTSALCGGPGNSPCPGGPNAITDWNRDAVVSENPGFDCAKGHPANGNYHHHQNPSAFDLDLVVISSVCNLYEADGLYVIDSTQHSPLIGYAYDGYPIYGAYAYKNADGTGGIVRMKSGYQLRNMTTRATAPDGTDVPDGPDVSSTYPLGYFREDYEFITHTGEEDYLDEHNGRFCITPEYPNGIYCYYATVDGNWNSAYPYVVGPTFYGNVTAETVTSVDETTTIYGQTNGLSQNDLDALNIDLIPNPASDLVAIQVKSLLTSDLGLTILDATGRVVNTTQIPAGSTIAYIDTQTLYAGEYFVKITSSDSQVIKKLMIVK